MLRRRNLNATFTATPRPAAAAAQTFPKLRWRDTKTGNGAIRQKRPPRRAAFHTF